MSSARPPAPRATAAIVSTLVVLVTAGCTTTQEDATRPGAAIELGHIHGLGVNPGDGELFVASHNGVFRVPEGDRPQLVADRAQDTMAFTITGPSTFLASGHPDPVDRTQPTSLGLIESTDAAMTWTSRSLAGRADFHVLEPTDAGTYGYDSHTARLMHSVDLQAWTTVASGQLYDVAANPEQPSDLLATTPAGLTAPTGGDLGDLVGDRRDLVLIERPTAALSVAVTNDAQVLTSTDRGLTWSPVARLDGQAQALTTDQAGWHLATTSGIWTSTDQGVTWERALDLR